MSTNNRSVHKLMIILLAVGIMLTLVFFAVRLYLTQVTANTEVTIIEVSSGQSVKSLARQLKEKKILTNDTPFRVWLLIKGLDKKIQVGEYAIQPHMPLRSLIWNFVHGRVYQHSFKIIPGDAWQQINARIKSSGLKGLNQSEIRKLQGRAVNLEGLFAPDTYFYVKGEAAYNILKIAKEKQKRVLYELWHSRHSGLVYKSPTDILVVASLIEKETALNDERPMISRVIHNRLRAGMRLQIDASFLYAQKSEGMKLQLKQALLLKSPYNTYKYYGLPPGPIAAVSRASLQAAAKPVEGNWLYYRSLDKRSHVFSHQYAQHVRLR